MFILFIVRLFISFSFLVNLTPILRFSVSVSESP